MLKRYQVFVSSTYNDLKKERFAAMQALMKVNCFPAGMELFYTGNMAIIDMIKKTIDESDFYLLIIGGKYGSIHPQHGISFTELEYDYAVSKDKHILRFVHEDIDRLPAIKREVEPERLGLLKSFIAKVRAEKFCNSWRNADSLQAEIATTMEKAKTEIGSDAGWIRANQADFKEVVNTAKTTLVNAMKGIQEEFENGTSLSDVPLARFADDEEEITVNYKYCIKTPGDGDYYYSLMQHSGLTMMWNDFYAVFLTCFRESITLVGFIKAIEEYIKDNKIITDSPEHLPVITIDKAQCQRIINHMEAYRLIDNTGNGFLADAAWVLTERGKRRLFNASVFETGYEDEN